MTFEELIKMDGKHTNAKKILAYLDIASRMNVDLTKDEIVAIGHAFDLLVLDIKNSIKRRHIDKT